MAETIFGGERIFVRVVFTNGGFARANFGWRVALRKGDETWIHDKVAFTDVAGVDPGQMHTVNPYVDVPTDWGSGEVIDVRLDAAVDGQEQHSIKEWLDFFQIPAPDVSWIKITSAEPYVAE